MSTIARELAEKKDFIVFAGTGAPLSAGVPNWHSLLKALLKVCPLENVDIDKTSPEEFPDIAQKIFDSLKERNREKDYFKTIKKIIKPKNSPCTEEQIEIAMTTNWIITTNFDDTFESTFKKILELTNTKKRIKIESLPEFSMVNLFKESIMSIIYLHGNTDEEHIIFKKDDYELYYPSVSHREDGVGVLEDYLKYIFKNYTIVFIGFSFNDFYVKEFLKKIFMELKRLDDIASTKVSYTPQIGKIKHYAFLKKLKFGNERYLIENYENFHPESEESKKVRELINSKKLDKYLESMNIKVIRCNEYIDWINCFEEIRELKREVTLENGE